MLNDIIKGIGKAIKTEFGDGYTIYPEQVKQGLKDPCFFISCLNPTNKLFLGRRYFRQNKFSIQYLPALKNNNKKQECNDFAERLYSCLEYISITDGLIRGSKMSAEQVDDALHFFVNYDAFVYRVSESDAMEELETGTIVKG
jgi:hypothetical protein